MAAYAVAALATYLTSATRREWPIVVGNVVEAIHDTQTDPALLMAGAAVEWARLVPAVHGSFARPVRTVSGVFWDGLVE